MAIPTLDPNAPEFTRRYVNLADPRLGAQALEASDDFFAPKERMLNPEPAVFIPGKFDDYCWDLYARVGPFYAAGDRGQLRQEALQALEHGAGEAAAIGRYVSRRVVECHLQTMNRINIRYDLLPKESQIIELKFWATAFQLFKDAGAIYLQNTGKNQGCWVLKTDEPHAGDDPEMQEKVIVRSNGTVTYVGKDMAYQLWKIGKLGLDFRYQPFHT